MRARPLANLQFRIRIEYLLKPSICFALSIYFFLSFLNVDPLHDGWFFAPAVKIGTEKGITLYGDAISAYGWVTPTLQGYLVEIFGVLLLPQRLLGFIIFTATTVLMIKSVNLSLSKSAGLSLALLNLLIGLGQITRTPESAALGLWPNTLMLPIFLGAYFALRRIVTLNQVWLLVTGALVGLLPYIRAQGIIFSLFWLLLCIKLLRKNGILNRSKFVIVAWSVTTIAPLIVILARGLFEEFFWQTVLMPLSKEWVGMPKVASWLYDYGRATFSAGLVCGLGAIVSKKVSQSFGAKAAFLFSVLIIGSTLLFMNSLSAIFSSAGFLHTANDQILGTFLFMFPSMALATLLILLAIKITMSTRRKGFIEEILYFLMFASCLLLVYYNFFHIGGLLPVLVVALVHFKGYFLGLFPNYFQFVAAFSIVLSVIALKQTYEVTKQDFIAYQSKVLKGMFGVSNDMTNQIDANLVKLEVIPKGEKVFFDCPSALYSVANGSYMSDNIFYSSVMTQFNQRDEKFQKPGSGTKYLVQCDSVPKYSVEDDFWVEVTGDLLPTSSIRIFKRSTK